VWARDLPGSPLVQARSRWQDAIDVRTFDPVEMKACRYWHAAAGIEGAWRLRRPQHDRLRERGGYYILVVYKALPAGEKQRRLRIKHAIALTPSAVEARCGSLAWRCTEHDTYGWIRVTDMRWPQLVADAKVSTTDETDLAEIRDDIEAAIDRELAGVTDLTQRVIDGELSTF